MKAGQCILNDEYAKIPRNYSLILQGSNLCALDNRVYVKFRWVSWCISGSKFLIRHGEPYRDFSAIIGWKALSDSISLFGVNHEFTKLVVNLEGKDPDDAFSSVPYEKGFIFLYHLETVLGKEKWDKFIPHVFHLYSLHSPQLRSLPDSFSNLKPCDTSISKSLRANPSTLTNSRPPSSISFHPTRQQHPPSDRLTGIPGSMPPVYQNNPTSTPHSLTYAMRLRLSGNREPQRHLTRAKISSHIRRIFVVGVQISWLSSWRKYRNLRILCQKTMWDWWIRSTDSRRVRM